MQLRTLGAFELVNPANPSGGRVLTAGKALAVLAYLARCPGYRASRDTLLDLLWSDVDPERGRRTLRQTLWSLRQRLGEASLRNEGEDLVLAVPLVVDATQFEADARAGRLEEAWARYRGHFIPFFATPGGAAFEHWADAERSTLRTMWHTVGITLARTALAEGQTERCLMFARALREDDPERQEPWCLLIRAHLDRQQRVQARLEAESAASLFARFDRRPEGQLAALIAETQQVPPPSVGGALPARIEPDLVGRETPFATLITAWQATAAGDGRTIVVRSPAGVGKTRLLRDFHARLTALGVSPLLIRARPADRDLPYGLAATLAERLGSLPGARAISPAAAATLVDLVPALSNWFPSLHHPPRQGEELLRVRTLALAELLEAVSDEHPVAILVDDLHWADDTSRGILASLSGRVTERPVLLVVATRPTGSGEVVAAAAQLLELDPLSPSQVEELLASIANGEAALLGGLAESLHAASAGVPLLVLAAIELLLARQHLRLDGGSWECDDPGALREVLSKGGVIDQVLQSVPARAARILLALAVAGRPLPAEVLDAVLGSQDGGLLAGSLEQRGLAVRVGTAWEVSHDRVAESAVAGAPAGERDEVAAALGHALLNRAGGQPQALRDAGRLLASVGDPATAEVFVAWLDAMNRAALWRNPGAAASEFLGSGTARLAPADLARRVTPLARARGGWRTAYRIAQTAVVIGLAVAGTLSGRRLLAPVATGIDVAFPPTSNGVIFDTVLAGYCNYRRDCGEVAFPVIVALRDAESAPTTRGARLATIRLVSSEGAVLAGDTVARFGGGVARFDGLRILGQGLVEAEVRTSGLPPVRSGPILVHAGGGTGPRLRVLSGIVAGQPVDSLRRTVVVRPGQELDGAIRFSYVSIWRTAAVMLGAIPFWGDRRSNFMPIGVLPSHGLGTADLALENPTRPRTRLVAPSVPGRYRLLFTFDAETEMRFIASSTNWVLGNPAWGDGNDLVDLPDSLLAEMDRDGWTKSTIKLRGKQVGRPEERFMVAYPLAGTTLTIIVRE